MPPKTAKEKDDGDPLTAALRGRMMKLKSVCLGRKIALEDGKFHRVIHGQIEDGKLVLYKYPEIGGLVPAGKLACALDAISLPDHLKYLFEGFTKCGRTDKFRSIIKEYVASDFPSNYNILSNKVPHEKILKERIEEDRMRQAVRMYNAKNINLLRDPLPHGGNTAAHVKSQPKPSQSSLRSQPIHPPAPRGEDEYDEEEDGENDPLFVQPAAMSREKIASNALIAHGASVSNRDATAVRQTTSKGEKRAAALDQPKVLSSFHMVEHEEHRRSKRPKPNQEAAAAVEKTSAAVEKISSNFDGADQKVLLINGLTFTRLKSDTGCAWFHEVKEEPMFIEGCVWLKYKYVSKVGTQPAKKFPGEEGGPALEFFPVHPFPVNVNKIWFGKRTPFEIDGLHYVLFDLRWTPSDVWVSG